MDLLSDLTPAQREAVTHVDGPLLVIAGPGSGKTRVITRRVAYLLQQGIPPWNLLAITFTNKAAGEMKRRVEEIVPRNRSLICTFHSLGVRLLRQYGEVLGLERSFTIYDQSDRNQVVKSALEAANIDSVSFSPEKVQAAISRAKNQLISPEAYAQRAGDFLEQTVARVYPLYQRKLRDSNALDFDDLLYWLAYLLMHHAEVRAELDARFRYVLVDEYQDTNSAQYEIARRLSMDYPNLCVVGDPDQSIYRWRGSDIRNILDFERDYQLARVITLDRNYRSTKRILQAATGLIKHNRQRIKRELTTENPEGQPVQILTFENNYEEADGIAERIRRAVEEHGRRYRDFAVLMRINALSRALEMAFIRRRVPYQIVRGLAFFERKENKDILAYLRLVLNPKDDISFLRVVNEPARGIGKTSLDHLQKYADARQINLLSAATQVQQIGDIKGKATRALPEFAAMIHQLAALRDAPADEVIKQVLDTTGYRKALTANPDSEDLERLANIEELISAAHQFEAEDGAKSVAAFLEHVTLVSDVDAWDESTDQVSIMTLHAAKGLEFPVVYILAVEQNILPHERSKVDMEELEEERRLAFVGITRAKDECLLTLAKIREFRGDRKYSIPSPFLDELPREAVQREQVAGLGISDRDWEDEYVDDEEPHFTAPRSRAATTRRGPLPPLMRGSQLPPRVAKPKAEPVPGANYKGMQTGSTVRHGTYGLGKVIELSGFGAQAKVKIRFGGHGDKTFVLEKAPLELVK
jgi:DNA helicase-2/ATP-dependent DNA helicase PcrA